MDDFETLSELSLRVEDHDLRRRERETPKFTRVTTTVRLRGDGEAGRGEDVCYETADHDALTADPPALPTGEFTLGSFSRALDDRDLFPEPPRESHGRLYRRWAVESAALDLALRQAGTDLASAVGRAYRPLRFVASPGAGEAGFERIADLLDAAPGAELKLDPQPEWSDDLLARLADTGRVRVVDLKGHYEADLAPPADPDFYRRVLEAFPDAVVEDPLVTDATRPVLDPHRERLSWDYPITGLDAVRELPYEPDWLNIKPSRFGTLRSLFETLSWALEADVSLYGGGQFELGPGREHVQALASLYYPDGPNDVAPRAYNDVSFDSGLPASPLSPPAESLGLGWESA